MQILIQATSYPLTEELKRRIPKDLKGGTVQAYILAQEGESRPRVLNGENKPIIWTKKVLTRLHEKLKKGLKFFLGHNEDSGHENRKPVGELIDAFIDTVNGKLSNIILGHFPDPDVVKDADMNSVEADIYTVNSGDYETAEDVKEVTGIAVGSSKENSPAFPGALRLATIQCFEGTGGKPVENKEKKSGEGKTMTYDDVKNISLAWIKQMIEERQIHPNQLHDEKALRDDRVFGKIFEEREALQKQLETLKTEKETAVKAKESIEKETASITAKEKLKTLIPEGATKLTKDFILKNFDPSKMTDLSETGLKGYLEQAQKDFQETAKMFNYSEDPATKDAVNTPPEEPEKVSEAIKEIMGG